MGASCCGGPTEIARDEVKMQWGPQAPTSSPDLAGINVKELEANLDDGYSSYFAKLGNMPSNMPSNMPDTKMVADSAKRMSQNVGAGTAALLAAAKKQANEGGALASIQSGLSNASGAMNAKLEAAKAKLRQAVIAKIKEDHGEDAVGLLEGLSKVSNQVMADIGASELKYPAILNLVALRCEHMTHVDKEKSLKPLKLAGIKKPLMEEASYWCYAAAAAYGDGDPKADSKVRVFAAFTGAKINVEMIMADLPAKGVRMPGHFVAVDRAKKAVILGVRGTTTLSDALTDAAGSPAPIIEWPGVQAHEAMLHSARQVLERTRPHIEDALKKNPGFELLVTGHSLGAGTAILCTLILYKTPVAGKPKLRCFAYAPPPVCSDPAQVKAVEIYSFRNNFDLVPRASLSNVCRLGLQVRAVDSLAIKLADRISLLTSDYTGKQFVSDILKAVDTARSDFEKAPLPGYNPLYVPGTLFWIKPAYKPPPAPNQKDQTKPPDPEMYVVDATERQEIYIRGSLDAGLNHLCGSYQAGIDSVLARMN